MSLIRIKILKVISKTESTVTFEGTYSGGHSIFSPRGFTAEIHADPNVFIEGWVYVECNFPETKILKWGDGHEEIMQQFKIQLDAVLK